MKLTKIVCTIGLKTEKKEYLSALVDAGMNVMRLNFSHGDHNEHLARIKTMKEVSKEKDKYIPILLDTKGPEIRTGKMENEDVFLEKGQNFILTNEFIVGNRNRTYVTYDKLSDDVKKGDTILLDDGLIRLEVSNIINREVICEVRNSGELGSNKGVNLPNINVNLPALSDKDIEDVIFGCKNKVDYIAASFIRKKSDVEEFRNILDKNGGEKIKIISKIENREGLENFEEILNVSDGIMVARGDLGVEIPLEEVPLAQKMMIRRCNEVSKIVITATQMLESMIKNPRPTRAEVADITNAILDGTDAIMLSGETAKHNCPYPIEAVDVMTTIARKVDVFVEPKINFNVPKGDYIEAIAKGVVEVAQEVSAKLIIASSLTGKIVLKIRKYFPKQPILVLTNDIQVARQMMIVRGVYSKVIDKVDNHDVLYDLARKYAKDIGLVNDGDIAVISAGGSIGSIGITDMLKIIKI